MSRIANTPINLPKDVQVSVDEWQWCACNGPRGRVGDAGAPGGGSALCGSAK